MKSLFWGVFLSTFSLTASASTLYFGGTSDELEKIQFRVALDAAKAALDREDRLVSLIGTAYENGDVYYLNGNLDDQWTKDEWDQYYTVAKWFIHHHFRVIMNPIANADDVQEAVQNPTSSVIIWSSHGDVNGLVYDTSSKPLPVNIFSTGASKKLKLVVLSNCYSESTVKDYSFAPQTRIYHWIGTTTSQDLFGYLFSTELAKDLGI